MSYSGYRLSFNGQEKKKKMGRWKKQVRKYCFEFLREWEGTRSDKEKGNRQKTKEEKRCKINAMSWSRVSGWMRESWGISAAALYFPSHAPKQMRIESAAGFAFLFFAFLLPFPCSFSFLCLYQLRRARALFFFSFFQSGLG